MELLAIAFVAISIVITIVMIIDAVQYQSNTRVILSIALCILSLILIGITIYAFCHNTLPPQQEKYIADMYRDQKFDKPKLIVIDYIDPKSWSFLERQIIKVTIHDTVSFDQKETGEQ